MKEHILVLSIMIVLAGCPADTSPNAHSLGPRMTVEETNTGFVIEGTVDLEGKPPSNITYNDVKLVLLSNGTRINEYNLGDITNSRSSVEINISVTTCPDQILVVYENVEGINQPGNVYGYELNGNDSKEYMIFNNYNPERDISE